MIQHVFSCSQGMKLAINNRRKLGKFKTIWKLTTYCQLQTNQKGIHRKIKKHLEMKENEETT